MSGRPLRILAICPYAAWPPIGGGKLRIFHLVSEWLRLGHIVDVWVVPADEPELAWDPVGPRPRAIVALPARTRRSVRSKLGCLTSRYPEEAWSRPVPASAQVRPGDYDVAVLMQAHVGRFAEPLVAAGLPVLLDQQNVEGEISRQVARLAPTAMGRFRARLDVYKWRAWERALVRRTRRTVAVSEADAAAFRALDSDASVVVRPSGADLRNRRFVDHATNRSDAVIMTGTLGYLPNLDAARWMIDSILPEVRRRRPRVHLLLVGASAPDELREAAPPWVDVVGRVPDVAPYLDRADLFVAPLRAGGGTRLKLLEAFAVGLPVVGTTIASSGIDVRHGVDLVTADDAQGLADAIVELLEDADRRRAVATSARRLVEERYAWSSIARAFEADLLEVARGGPRPSPRSLGEPG